MANINIRVDDALKAEAQELYRALGMDLSTAVNIFLRQSVQMQGLPFRPRLEPAEIAEPDDIDAISRRLIEKNHAAYEVLAK
ncbi:MAG: type II toxin-antitoxin system RelB/DinJ family antitoxin [Oscillospiraceae bacterium]|nr:type II toxin-antitoxin system RelB/DinJ family antitoxin [Oscillospiraceae bacterium]